MYEDQGTDALIIFLLSGLNTVFQVANNKDDTIRI